MVLRTNHERLSYYQKPQEVVNLKATRVPSNHSAEKITPQTNPSTKIILYQVSIWRINQHLLGTNRWNIYHYTSNTQEQSNNQGQRETKKKFRSKYRDQLVNDCHVQHPIVLLLLYTRSLYVTIIFNLVPAIQCVKNSNKQ